MRVTGNNKPVSVKILSIRVSTDGLSFWTDNAKAVKATFDSTTPEIKGDAKFGAARSKADVSKTQVLGSGSKVKGEDPATGIPGELPDTVDFTNRPTYTFSGRLPAEKFIAFDSDGHGQSKSADSRSHSSASTKESTAKGSGCSDFRRADDCNVGSTETTATDGCEKTETGHSSPTKNFLSAAAVTAAIDGIAPPSGDSPLFIFPDTPKCIIVPAEIYSPEALTPLLALHNMKPGPGEQVYVSDPLCGTVGITVYNRELVESLVDSLAAGGLGNKNKENRNANSALAPTGSVDNNTGGSADGQSPTRTGVENQAAGIDTSGSPAFQAGPESKGGCSDTAKSPCSLTGIEINREVSVCNMLQFAAVYGARFPDGIFVYGTGTNTYISVMSDGRMVVCESLPHHSAHDVAYFLGRLSQTIPLNKKILVLAGRSHGMKEFMRTRFKKIKCV